MSASVQDRPGLNQDSFSASLVETPGAQHSLTVRGDATGDYRVEDVQFVRSHHQHGDGTLVLDVTAKVAPFVGGAHPDFIKLWPLTYTETPAHHDYGEVRIVNGSQHFTVKVVSAL